MELEIPGIELTLNLWITFDWKKGGFKKTYANRRISNSGFKWYGYKSK